MRLTDEGGDKRRRTSQGLPLIRPSVRTGAPSPLWGEGFWPAQIGRDSALCGTFGYIYWELGRSAPVGGGRPSVPPLRRRRGKPGRRVREAAPYKRGGGGKSPPYVFPPKVLELGRGALGFPPGNQRAGEDTRPYTAFTNSSAYRKRDRFWTCPLKPRGEAELRRKFLCLLSFSKKVRGSGGEPEPLTCVCCKGEGEMGDMYDYWVR